MALKLNEIQSVVGNNQKSNSVNNRDMNYQIGTVSNYFNYSIKIIKIAGNDCPFVTFGASSHHFGFFLGTGTGLLPQQYSEVNYEQSALG